MPRVVRGNETKLAATGERLPHHYLVTSSNNKMNWVDDAEDKAYERKALKVFGELQNYPMPDCPTNFQDGTEDIFANETKPTYLHPPDCESFKPYEKTHSEATKCGEGRSSLMQLCVKRVLDKASKFRIEQLPQRLASKFGRL